MQRLREPADERCLSPLVFEFALLLLLLLRLILRRHHLLLRLRLLQLVLSAATVAAH